MFYKRCLCCGNYFEVEEAKKDYEYCSIECIKKFSRCKVCGTYFEVIFDNKYHNNNFCSKECFDIITKKIKYDFF